MCNQPALSRECAGAQKGVTLVSQFHASRWPSVIAAALLPRLCSTTWQEWTQTNSGGWKYGDRACVQCVIGFWVRSKFALWTGLISLLWTLFLWTLVPLEIFSGPARASFLINNKNSALIGLFLRVEIKFSVSTLVLDCSHWLVNQSSGAWSSKTVLQKGGAQKVMSFVLCHALWCRVSMWENYAHLAHLANYAHLGLLSDHREKISHLLFVVSYQFFCHPVTTKANTSWCVYWWRCSCHPCQLPRCTSFWERMLGIKAWPKLNLNCTFKLGWAQDWSQAKLA